MKKSETVEEPKVETVNKEPEVPMTNGRRLVNPAVAPPKEPRTMKARMRLERFLEENEIILELPPVKSHAVEGGGLVIDPPSLIVRYSDE